MIGKRFHDDDEAVSPVIGVILMVAITVILAAVIGTFVLNLGGSVQENVQAGASVTTTTDGAVKVTWTSDQNANSLDVDISSDDCGSINGDSTQLTSVGSSWTSPGTCTTGDTATVIVTANGDGDASTVIIDREVDF